MRSFLLLPHRYGGLSWSHSIRALVIRRAQTLLGCTQAHKTEFGFTPRAHQTSTVLLVVFQQHAALGTSANGGTVANALHFFELDVWTLGQDVQRTLAADVVAAIWAGGWTFPLLHALPAECVRRTFPCGAHWALQAEVVGVLSAHQKVAARTLERQVVILTHPAQPLFHTQLFFFFPIFCTEWQAILTRPSATSYFKHPKIMYFIFPSIWLYSWSIHRESHITSPSYPSLGLNNSNQN